ncbi:MAG: HAD-IC family P-type ATPase [Gemmatimonadaceae bacterium]|nr:HAD-IC family P-type ATPase [Gemmatimonadaceae bacterium]
MPSSKSATPRPAGVNVAWHAIAPHELLARLATEPTGLRSDDAAQRLRTVGPNRLSRTRRDGPWRLFLRQFTSPLIHVLLASVAIALALGKRNDGLVILAVVVINAIVGFLQELEAGRAIDALSRMVPSTATVRRDGESVTLATDQLVPGDVVALQGGDTVPADVRLLDVTALQIEEAVLTGESLPIAKRTETAQLDASLGDRRGMAFGGTLVTAGTGVGVVVETGDRTELGRISTLLRTTVGVDTPLTRRLASLARGITVGIIAIALVIVAIGVARDAPVIDSLLASISLAVAAIPEGLPATITIASAIGVRRMARRRALVRHLPAVETLGSTTIICTDKTGTLTRNELTVRALWTARGPVAVSGVGYAPIGTMTAGDGTSREDDAAIARTLEVAALCNDATVREVDGRWTITGDPTEAALVVAARKGAIDDQALRVRHARIDAIPFDAERQFMATRHVDGDGRVLVCVKGAPEVLLGFTSRRAEANGWIAEAVETLASQGMRVLAMAHATVPRADCRGDLAIDDLPRLPLEIVGLAGMMDPAREEAISAIAACRTAGVRVSMITGDHPSTARAIARQVGLVDAHADGVLTGQQLAAMPADALPEAAATYRVFARVAPEQKLRLVEALQSRGEIVAMTGDGVNDAPALKRADIGVAMGITGTAVAREAADMVLADDNFATIAAAVEEGRRVFDNLLKSLAFILPTSVGQGLIILIAVLTFPVRDGRLLMPIDPVQILWVNLVVATTLALPLAFEAPEPDLMRRPPRAPSTPLLDGFLVARTVLVGMLIAAAAIGVFWWEFALDTRRGLDAATALTDAQTGAVTAVVLFQAAYLLNCRSLTRSARTIGLWSNPHVYYGIATALALQWCAVYLSPFNRLLRMHPIAPVDWLVPIAVACAGLPVIAVEKWLWRRRRTGPTLVAPAPHASGR